MPSAEAGLTRGADRPDRVQVPAAPTPKKDPRRGPGAREIHADHIKESDGPLDVER